MVSTIDPTLGGDTTADGREVRKSELQEQFQAAVADIEALQAQTPSELPLPVAEGGTGAASLTDGGILLGSGTAAVTAMGVLADGSIVIGDGATDPTSISAFTSSTGVLRHEVGGIEADISAIADGGLLVGTGAGTMAVRASALTGGASGFLTHEVGGLEFDASAVADGDFLVGTGAGTMGLESGATARSTMGLGTFATENISAVPALTLAGQITGADQIVSRINLLDYGEVTNAIGSIGGGTQDIDLTLGNVVSGTVDTSTTTFTFSNPTASDEGCGFTLVLTNGGSQTVNWPASVDWPGGTAPTLTASGVDILVFLTIDGGTTWHGVAASADSS